MAALTEGVARVEVLSDTTVQFHFASDFDPGLNEIRSVIRT